MKVVLPGKLGIFAVSGLIALAGPIAGQAQTVGSPATTAIAPGAAPIGPGAAEATIPQAASYRIRQGDEVTVTIFGEPMLTPAAPVRVLQGGAISLTLVGDVLVAGKTTVQAGRAVEVALRRYVRDPHVVVAVYSVAPVAALVLGNVKAPGKYALPPPAHLGDVLAAAGGLGPIDGDFPDARIVRADGAVQAVSLQKLLHDGDTTQNVEVESGDSVYVPAPETFTVQVLGAVDKPGAVEVHKGDDIAMAVARAGASTNSNPDLNHVQVTRRDASGGQTRMMANLYDIMQRGDTSHDIVMQKNDLVFVPQAKKGGIAGPLDLLGALRRLVLPF
jgi:polysaccharide export outer membrane protein